MNQFPPVLVVLCQQPCLLREVIQGNFKPPSFCTQGVSSEDGFHWLVLGAKAADATARREALGWCVISECFVGEQVRPPDVLDASGGYAIKP